MRNTTKSSIFKVIQVSQGGGNRPIHRPMTVKMSKKGCNYANNGTIDITRVLVQNSNNNERGAII